MSPADLGNRMLKVYFAHPYTSWKRAQNERHNGLLLRYIPKGISIENYSDEDIIKIEAVWKDTFVQSARLFCLKNLVIYAGDQH